MTEGQEEGKGGRRGQTARSGLTGSREVSRAQAQAERNLLLFAK